MITGPHARNGNFFSGFLIQRKLMVLRKCVLTIDFYTMSLQSEKMKNIGR